MKIASLVYATEQGLGYLAKDFHDNGLIDLPIIIKHHRKNHPEWYRDGLMVEKPGAAAVRNRLREADIALFFETPFDWSLIKWCRGVGIKTVLMPMHECTPRLLPAKPDLILAPSHLDRDIFIDSEYIPVPVPRPIVWKERTEAKVFVHNAGHGGLMGRNGTKEVLEALRYVQSPATVILRSQDTRLIPTDKVGHTTVGNVKVIASVGTVQQKWLYDSGDVFIFPERNNGLSLPLQEAFASGMMVMAGARYPMTEWLPTSPLIKVDRYTTESIRPGWMEFDRAHYSPQEIAATIDRWYGKDITQYSRLGKVYAEQNSWDALKPIYIKTFEDLLK